MANNGVVDDRLTVYVHNGKEYKMLQQERLFAIAFVRNGGKGGEAVVTAGYKCKNSNVAGSISSELLRRPRVFDLIRDLQDDIAFQLGITAVDIAREYAKIGFADIRKVFDPESGEMLDINAIDDVTAATIASYEALEVYDSRTGKFVGKNKKVKFHPKVVALDALARMIGADSKTQTLAQANNKPAPLEITIKKVEAKIKKHGDDGTISGNTE